MIIPTKKLKNGFEMPAFGIGTWQMGGRHARNYLNDDGADIRAIQEAIKLGVTHIDTAEVYAGGYAEKLVGRAIDGIERKKLFLVSKVTPAHFGYKDVIKACKDSLARLGTSYLDLYLLHHPNPSITIGETMSAMDFLAEEGLIKNIGVSNFRVETFKRAQSAAKNKIVANQVHYNLKFREPEVSGLLDYCQENDVMLIAWRPVEKGFLTQKSKFKILDEVCKKYKKTPAQVAINWLISQKNVVTLAKSSNLDHLRENLGGVSWVMGKRDVEKLAREFPEKEEISDAVPLS